MRNIIATLYNMVDKRSLRALSLVMAIVLGISILSVPAVFAAQTSNLEIWHGLVLMWAVCSGFIHGIGFHLRSIVWQGLFCPILAILLLLAGLIYLISLLIS